MTRFPRLRRFLKAVGILVALLVTFSLATTSGCATFGALTFGEHQKAMDASPSYVGGRFKNLETRDVYQNHGGWDAAKEYVVGGRSDRQPPAPLPLHGTTAQDLKTPTETGLRVTWFGHSGTLIEVDGLRVLTDPHWSLRASPFSVVGPKRFHPPVMPLAQLGHLDAVVISHDHYDHLDMETVQTLAKTGVKFLVGLGVGAHLEAWGIPAFQVREMDWWNEELFAGAVKVVSTPAYHFSGRLIPMGDPTLWTSWSIIGPNHRVFFSGDSGMSGHMKDIGDKLGPFDLTMLEVGQFHPSWGDIHLGPEGALKAHAALRGKTLMPIHWCTFELGLHGWSQPAEETFTLAQAVQVTVLTPMLGQPVEPQRWQPVQPWWRAVGKSPPP